MRIRLIYGAVFTAMVLIDACSSPISNERGDAELLKSAIQQLQAKQQLAYEVQSVVNVGDNPRQNVFAYQGMMSEHNQLFVKQVGIGSSDPSSLHSALLTRVQAKDTWIAAESIQGLQSAIFQQWGPLNKLEQLNHNHEKVSRDKQEHTQGNEVVLRVTCDAEEMKSVVLADLAVQQGHVDVDNRVNAAKARELPAATILKLQNELEQAAANSEERLEQMSASLRAQGYYLLWINLNNGLPRKLVIHSDLSYLLDDKPKQETVVTTYDFKESDRSGILPQS